MTEKEEAFVFVTVRMPAEVVRQIDELAIESMRSRSAEVIMLLKRALSSCPTEGQ